jgi:hypothetical protein
MFKTFEFCIPTAGIKVPAGPDWLHEIKYDGSGSGSSGTATTCG